MRTFLLVITFFMARSLAAQTVAGLKTNADNNTVLWEVSGNGLTGPSYLLGTFHMLCKEDIHFSDALKKALAGSSSVYMELDMDDPSTMMGGLTMMSMKDGKKLKDLFTEDEYRRIETFFKDSLKTSLGMFQSMKPLMLSSLVYPKLMACKNMSGIEQQLLQLAKENKKEVYGLETIAFQASVLDSIPYKEQATELIRMVDSLEKSKRYLDSMIVAYKNQDMATLERMLNSDEYGIDGDQGVLLDQRNRNWVSQLKVIMQKGPVFVAVGAGHLPGELGVINLLRKEGYTLRPVQNK